MRGFGPSAAGLVTVVAIALVASVTISAEPAAPASSVAQAAPDFTLPDSAGKPHAISDLKDAELVAVVFLGTECPLARLYAPRLNALAAEYAAKGVRFVGIDSNVQDTAEEIAKYVTDHSITFPVLVDPESKVADGFKAERTPEVFVLDHDRVVRYSGRIDDQYGVGFQKQQATRADLELAIGEVLAGKAVSQPRVSPTGCVIGRVKRAEPNGQVTYTKHIAPILKASCIECHHEGQIAPFSLTDYNEVVGWAEMIQEVVHERRMPPWLAAPEHDQFKNNPTLTKDQVATIDKWVEGGCPEGDAADLPAPAEFAQGWGISQPDQVFYM